MGTSERPPTDGPAAPAGQDGARGDGTVTDRTVLRAIGEWSAIGLEFGASVVAFFLLGSWLDATWGTHPWMRVAGAFLGIVLGTYLLIKKALASGSAANAGPEADPPDRSQRPRN